MYNICYCFDDHFILPTFISITSVIVNNPNIELTFNLLYSGDEDIKNDNNTIKKYSNKLKSNKIHFCIKKFNNIHKVKVEKDNILGNKIRQNIANISRYFIDEYFDVEDKFLYLDGDILVENNITKIFYINMEEKVICAAPNYSKKPIKSVFNAHHLPDYLELFGTNIKDRIFQAGVLLISSKNWKKYDIKNKILKFIQIKNESKKRRYIIKKGTQPLLNLICNKHLIFMSKKNNVLVDTSLKKFKKKYTNDNLCYHFKGQRRQPWLDKNDIYFEWWNYYNIFTTNKSFKDIKKAFNLKSLFI